jgi:hypothetical protein
MIGNVISYSSLWAREAVFKRQKSVRSFMHSIIIYTVVRLEEKKKGKERKKEIKSGWEVSLLDAMMLIHRYST